MESGDNPKKGIFRFTTSKDLPLLVASTIAIVISSLGSPLETYLYGKIFTKLATFLSDGSKDKKSFLSKIGFFCGEIVVVGAVRMLLTWLGVIGWLMVGERAQIRGRKKVFNYILSQDFEKISLQKNLIGSLTQVHRSIEEIRAGVSENLGILIQTCTSIVFLFITSMISLWLLTLVVLASAPVMVLSSYYFGKLALKFSAQENERSAVASKVLDWCLKAGLLTRVLNGKYFDMARFKRNVDLSAKSFTFFAMAIDANSSVLRALSGFVFLQGLVIAQHLVKIGKANAGQIFTSFSACMLLGSQIASLADLIAMINKAQASSQSIELLGFFTTKFKDITKEKVTCDFFGNSCSVLTLENISFGYDCGRATVLNNVSAQFSSESLNFVVGLSGSGKSTLAHIIAGLYSQSSGHIYLDGVNISKYSIQSISLKILFIDSSPLVFKRLLRENILLGLSKANTGDIYSALRFCDMTDFKNSLHSGLDTIVEDRKLSGGQIQKIGLARAFLRNPPILILDEALSAIDFYARKNIMRHLRELRRGKLTILITHDGEDIESSDTVLCLKAGKVTDFRKAHLKTFVRTKKFDNYDESKNQFTLFTEKVELDSETLTCEPTPDDPEKQLGDNNDIRPLGLFAVLNFCSSTSKKKPLIILGAFAALATGLTPPFLSYLFSKLLSRIVDQSATQSHSKSTTWLVKTAIILIAVDGIVHFVSKFSLHYALEKWIVSLRNRCLSIISDQDMSFFSTKHLSASDLTTLLMNDTRDLRSVISELVPGILELLALVLAGIIWSIFAGWKLTLVGLSLFPLIVILSAGYGVVLQKVEADYKTQIASSENHVHEAVSGIKTIKSLGLTEQWAEEYEQKLHLVHPIGLRRAIVDGFGVSILQLCTSAASAIILYYGVYLIAKLLYTLDQMLLVLTMLTFTISGVDSVVKRLPTVARGQRAAQLLCRLLSFKPLPLEAGGNSNFRSDSRMTERISVCFKNVGFSYESQGSRFKTVLRKASFQLKSGESVALVGPSGSGKSTIGSLLLRLYEPEGGCIQVFGQDLNLVKADQFRSVVAMVPQRPQFFEATIRENLIYGTLACFVSDTVIIAALRAVNAVGVIDRLPNGLETQYGNEVLFSAGELQRLCIARALIRKPLIIVFDEPTSNLDDANTRIIVDLITTGLKAIDKKMTIITITHDPNIMKQVHRILVINDGMIRQDGEFNELLSIEGPFKRVLNDTR